MEGRVVEGIDLWGDIGGRYGEGRGGSGGGGSGGH